MSTARKQSTAAAAYGSQEAECSVIGSVLLDPRRMREVLELVRASDFLDDRNAQVFGQLEAMHHEGITPDVTLLTIRLSERTKLAEPASLVLEYTSKVAVAAHAAYYASLVREKAQRRQALMATDTAIAALQAADGSPEEVLTILRDALESIQDGRPGAARGRQTGKPMLLRDAVGNYLRKLADHRTLFSLGLPGVDYALAGGVAAGEVVIVAGRPSHGKTAVGLQAVDCLAKSMPVLIVSEEMSAGLLAQRILCSLTTRAPIEWESHREILQEQTAQHFTERQPVLVAESCGTVERAVDAIRRAKERNQIGACMVDYLQLLRGAGSSRYEQVSDVSTRLKQAAVEHDLVLLLLCQLNRGVESRATERHGVTPRMSDLRDSGQIEQDADVILFLDWPYRTAPDKHQEDEYRILVAKNRNRPIQLSQVHCMFKPDRQRLYEREWREEWQPGAEREAAFTEEF